MMALIKSALATTKRRIRLFYANRDRPSVIFEAEFEKLMAVHPERLEIIHHLRRRERLASPERSARRSRASRTPRLTCAGQARS